MSFTDSRTKKEGSADNGRNRQGTGLEPGRELGPVRLHLETAWASALASH